MRPYRIFNLLFLLPLLAVAAIYFILVAGLSACVARLERRLKKNER